MHCRILLHTYKSSPGVGLEERRARRAICRPHRSLSIFSSPAGAFRGPSLLHTLHTYRGQKGKAPEIMPRSRRGTLYLFCLSCHGRRFLLPVIFLTRKREVRERPTCCRVAQDHCKSLLLSRGTICSTTPFYERWVQPHSIIVPHVEFLRFWLVKGIIGPPMLDAPT